MKYSLVMPCLVYFMDVDHSIRIFFVLLCCSGLVRAISSISIDVFLFASCRFSGESVHECSWVF